MARWTALRVFSLLLTPLLIVIGAFAVLSSCGVIFAVRFHFHIASRIYFFIPQSRLAAFVVGVAAVALGLIFSVTVARFARLLPVMRGLIVGVQTVVLAVLIVVLFSNNTL